MGAREVDSEHERTRNLHYELHLVRPMILRDTLYLTSDRSLVVREGDKRAAFLVGRKGQTIPDKTAKKLGLLEESTPPVAPIAESAAVPEVTHRETGVKFRR